MHIQEREPTSHLAGGPTVPKAARWTTESVADVPVTMFLHQALESEACVFLSLSSSSDEKPGDAAEKCAARSRCAVYCSAYGAACAAAAGSSAVAGAGQVLFNVPLGGPGAPPAAAPPSQSPEAPTRLGWGKPRNVPDPLH
ncbi:hypothetical protein WJX81_007957 [Elliptochloris bilobata]|uniref:Uncharacterized protein n=1 Tax=Elliptochloris bilobata TaxID=381761 RepID=A0AAW1SL90_9CHLO